MKTDKYGVTKRAGKLAGMSKAPNFDNIPIRYPGIANLLTCESKVTRVVVVATDQVERVKLKANQCPEGNTGFRECSVASIKIPLVCTIKLNAGVTVSPTRSEAPVRIINPIF